MPFFRPVGRLLRYAAWRNIDDDLIDFINLRHLKANHGCHDRQMRTHHVTVFGATKMDEQ